MELGEGGGEGGDEAGGVADGAPSWGAEAVAYTGRYGFMLLFCVM